MLPFTTFSVLLQQAFSYLNPTLAASLASNIEGLLVNVPGTGQLTIAQLFANTMLMPAHIGNATNLYYNGSTTVGGNQVAAGPVANAVAEASNGKYATLDMTPLGNEITTLAMQGVFQSASAAIDQFLAQDGVTDTPYPTDDSLENAFLRGASEQFTAQGTGNAGYIGSSSPGVNSALISNEMTRATTPVNGVTAATLQSLATSGQSSAPSQIGQLLSQSQPYDPTQLYVINDVIKYGPQAALEPGAVSLIDVLNSTPNVDPVIANQAQSLDQSAINIAPDGGDFSTPLNLRLTYTIGVVNQVAGSVCEALIYADIIGSTAVAIGQVQSGNSSGATYTMTTLAGRIEGGLYGATVVGEAGAELGSLFGPVGTAAGGLIGSVVGGVVGYTLGQTGVAAIWRGVSSTLQSIQFNWSSAGDSDVPSDVTSEPGGTSEITNNSGGYSVTLSFSGANASGVLTSVVQNNADGTSLAINYNADGSSVETDYASSNETGTITQVDDTSASGIETGTIFSQTLNSDDSILDESNETVSGVLTIANGTTAVADVSDLTNQGTIDIEDPTSLTISGTLTNDGLVEIGQGSTLDINGIVTDDQAHVAPLDVDLGQDLFTTVATAQGVLVLGSATSASVSWQGMAAESSGDFRWEANYSRMENALDTASGAVTNPELVALGANTAAGLSIVPGFPPGALLEPATNSISYTFSSAISGSTPFFLFGPGDYDHAFAQSGYDNFGSSGDGVLPPLPGVTPNQEQTYNGPFTYTFSASLDGNPVSTAGWTFSVVSPLAGASPLANYSINAQTGVLTVTDFPAATQTDAIVIAIPNTPIDSITVTADTTFDDEWGLALPSPGGQIQIGDDATAEFDSSVDQNQIITFGNDSMLVVTGNSTSFDGWISGFASGDIIHYTQQSLTIGPAGQEDSIQDVSLESGGGYAGFLDFAPDVNLSNLTATPDGTGGTFITLGAVTCFAAGTHIAAMSGERLIENLTIGDLAHTHFAELAPVKWIGHRRVDCCQHPDPHKVWPVRVRAGAFGKDLPRRDLWLSPDHAVYVNDVLIPVKYLINGCTIVQEPCDEVTYYHIELDQHDVLLAEGLPVESYLDTGDRSKFSNGGAPIVLHPDFSTRMWEAMGCAPLIVTGPVLASVRARLLQRAAELAVETGRRISAPPKSRAA